MRLTYEGADYDVDLDGITIDEWRQLKAKYKMTPAKFQVGLSEADPDASTFFYWLMLRRAGNQRVVLSDDLRPDVIALNKAIAASEAGEPEPEDEPEPERPTQPSASPAASPPAPVTPAPALPAPGEVTAAPTVS